MADARFEPRRGAYGEILSSPEVRSAIDGLASRMASAAGSGFEWNSQQGTRRWRAIVYAASHSARSRNARDNTLVRVLGGSRL